MGNVLHTVSGCLPSTRALRTQQPAQDTAPTRPAPPRHNASHLPAARQSTTSASASRAPRGPARLEQPNTLERQPDSQAVQTPYQADAWRVQMQEAGQLPRVAPSRQDSPAAERLVTSVGVNRPTVRASADASSSSALQRSDSFHESEADIKQFLSADNSVQIHQALRSMIARAKRFNAQALAKAQSGERVQCFTMSPTSFNAFLQHHGAAVNGVYEAFRSAQSEFAKGVEPSTDELESAFKTLLVACLQEQGLPEDTPVFPRISTYRENSAFSVMRFTPDSNATYQLSLGLADFFAASHQEVRENLAQKWRQDQDINAVSRLARLNASQTISAPQTPTCDQHATVALLTFFHEVTHALERIPYERILPSERAANFLPEYQNTANEYNAAMARRSEKRDLPSLVHGKLAALAANGTIDLEIAGQAKRAFYRLINPSESLPIASEPHISQAMDEFYNRTYAKNSPDV
jgi:hypothetical protein